MLILLKERIGQLAHGDYNCWRFQFIHVLLSVKPWENFARGER